MNRDRFLNPSRALRVFCVLLLSLAFPYAALAEAPSIGFAGSFTVNEDVNTNTGNITVSTTNSSASVTITITITQGVLSAPGFSGNGTSSITRTATAATLTTALASMTYQSGLNNNNNNTAAGSRTLNITAVNNTNGGSSTPSQVVSITAVNDPPVNTLPGGQVVFEDDNLDLSTLISIADVDINELGTPNMIVTLMAGNGFVGVADNIPGGVTAGQISSTMSNEVTLTAPLATINTTLGAANSVGYRGFQDFNGAETFSVIANDQGNTGIAGSSIASNSFAITVNASNDAPNVAGSFPNATEDVTSNIPGVTITDVDAGGGSITVDIFANKGALSATQGGLTSLTGNGSTNLTMQGTLANVNTAFGTLNYLSPLNNNSSVSIQVLVNDNGNSGAGGAMMKSRFLTLGVNPVNDAEAVSFPASVSGQDGVPIAIAVSVAGDAQETTSAELDVTLTVASGGITLGSTAFLTFSTGDGSNDQTMQFSGEVPDVNAALGGMTFNGLASDVLDILVDDQGYTGGGSLFSTGLVFITVNAVNDAPVVTPAPSASGNEDTPIPLNGTSISDQDIGGGNFTVTISATNGTMTVTGSGSAIVNNNGTANVTVTGNSNDVNNTVGTITYQGNLNFNGTDTVSINANDNGNTGSPGPLSGLGSVTVTLAPRNDNPAFTAPASVNATEDVAFPFTGGNTISVADPDAAEGNNTIRVSVGVNNGTVTLGTTTGLSFVSGANGTSTFSVEGTVGNLNTALATLSYLSGLHFNNNVGGPATLSLSANDLGQFGGGPNGTTLSTVTINLAAVNDPPAVNAPVSVNTPEDAATSIPGVSIADPDVNEGTGNVDVDLVVSNGTLSLSGPAAVVGNGSASVGVSGSLANVNATLANLQYTGDTGFNGADTLTIDVTDLGNFPGPAQMGNGSVTINVDSVNDAPVLNTAGNPFMDPIFKNELDNPGTLISDLLASDGNPITDADPGALQGIAVTSADDTNGEWEFSTDNGANWSPIVFPSAINATLLASDANTRIRFVPDVNFSGLIDRAIFFRAWDQTGLAGNGGTDDTSAAGGFTPYSTEFETADLVVAPRVHAKNDFDGDRVSDLAVFELTTGNWYIRGSTVGPIIQNWGHGGTTPTPGDYDGDGLDDIAVFERTTGNWYILQSSNGTTRVQNWGHGGTVPVPCDYDGDGIDDLAVFEKATGIWYVLQSSDSTMRVQHWGYQLTIPVPCDYDGDGLCDIAVFEPKTSTWYILASRTGELLTKTLGSEDTSPVPGDYDGDGCCDPAVFEPGTGNWSILESSTDTVRVQNWGYAGTWPTPGHYDTDDIEDIAVFEPATGNWYINGSDVGMMVFNWGYSATVPVHNQLQINLRMGLTP